MSQATAAATKTRTRRPLRAVPDLMAKLREAEIRVRLREAREQAGLSRDKMADVLTVHPKSVENYEKERVPWQLMNAWAEVTGTSVEWLLHGERGNSTSADGDDRLARIEALLVEIRDEIRDALRGEAEGLPGLPPALEADVPSRRAGRPGKAKGETG